MSASRVAVGPPLNGTIEIAGPDQFRLDALIRVRAKARNDPREVITDPNARYFGIAPGERTLLPADDAQIGNTGLDDWLREAQTPRHDATGPSSAERAAQRLIMSHTEFVEVLRRAGYPATQAQSLLRDLPDQIDFDRYGQAHFTRGVSLDRLIDAAGGSP